MAGLKSLSSASSFFFLPLYVYLFPLTGDGERVRDLEFLFPRPLALGDFLIGLLRSYLG
jgi:hypothetical protein